MEDLIFQFGKLYEITNIGVTIYRGDELVHPSRIDDFYPVRDCESLKNVLVAKADNQEVPAIIIDNHKVVFGCIHCGAYYYYFGPVATTYLDRVALHKFYVDYGLRKGVEKPVPVLSYHKILSYLALVTKMITGEYYTNAQLVEGNQLDIEPTEHEEKRFLYGSMSEEESHHTYMEEKALLDCVREGKVEEAQKYNEKLDSETGKMSKDELSHWRKLVTVAIALSTRAAIEGGVSPAEAYQLSDYYLQKSDSCSNVPELILCRDRAVKKLTQKVYEKKNQKHISNYIEKCCDYIGKHYREKIYLDDLAEEIGISPTYLSKLFVKEKGIKLQEYIVQIRVDRAANLLMYSDESIAKIGDYVNFPSQSYFGRVFRRYKNMTPKQYRDKYKPKEF